MHVCDSIINLSYYFGISNLESDCLLYITSLPNFTKYHAIIRGKEMQLELGSLDINFDLKESSSLCWTQIINGND